MNKTFLSLALVAAFSISFSVFAGDKEVEVKVSDMPAHVLAFEKEMFDEIGDEEKVLKKSQDNLDHAKKAKAKLEKDSDSKDVDDAIEFHSKALVEAQDRVATLKSAFQVIKNNHKSLYSKSLMNKITVPARYIGRLIADNDKVALALEVTGVAGISYVIYKSFFAQEEEDEDSL